MDCYKIRFISPAGYIHSIFHRWADSPTDALKLITYPPSNCHSEISLCDPLSRPPTYRLVHGINTAMAAETFGTLTQCDSEISFSCKPHSYGERTWD